MGMFPPADEVKDLSLDQCRQIDFSELAAFSNLRFLSLNNTGLASLGGFPQLTELSKLELSDNRIAGGLRALRACPKLVKLNLSGNKIATLAAVEELAPLPALEVLDLFGCPVTKHDQFRAKMFELFPSLVLLDRFDKDGVEYEDEDEDEEESNDEAEDEEDDAEEAESEEEPGANPTTTTTTAAPQRKREAEKTEEPRATRPRLDKDDDEEEESEEGIDGEAELRDLLNKTIAEDEVDESADFQPREEEEEDDEASPVGEESPAETAGSASTATTTTSSS